ncbi:MAG: IS66 family insertion sequence element accessory protein TnpB [Desulfotignum sp.]|nr:IS66 family insertion sequence element accessory protein TnpB [Desulfotignum sp.]
MITVPSDVKIYLTLGATDMRKSINGLSIIASEQMKLDIFSGHLFVFCNRSKTILKILYWDQNGFCVWQKRLEKDRFKWPGTHVEVTKAVSRKTKTPVGNAATALKYIGKLYKIEKTARADQLSSCEIYEKRQTEAA